MCSRGKSSNIKLNSSPAYPQLVIYIAYSGLKMEALTPPSAQGEGHVSVASVFARLATPAPSMESSVSAMITPVSAPCLASYVVDMVFASVESVLVMLGGEALLVTVKKTSLTVSHLMGCSALGTGSVCVGSVKGARMDILEYSVQTARPALINATASRLVLNVSLFPAAT